MRRALIAGGAGFIGSNLTSFLIEKGILVTVIDNCITGSKKNLEQLLATNAITYIEGDIADKKTLDALKKDSFDIIFHLASPASPIQYTRYPEETMLANSYGTRNLLQFLKEGHAKRLVITSTSEVYGDPLVHPQVETYWGNVNSFGPRACYDESKRFAEALCYTYIHSYGTDIKIARLFNTYGKNMEQNDGRVVSNFIMQALTKKPITIYGDGKQTRSFCHISDMVNALFALAETSSNDYIFNLGNPEEHTIEEAAKLIKELTHSPSEIVFQPSTVDDPKRRKPDITKAKTVLQWEPHTSFKDGIIATIPYFQTRFLQTS